MTDDVRGGDDVRWDDAMPAVYDRILGPALFEPYARHLAGIARGIAPEDVVEVAAGSGMLTRSLLEALPQAHLVATDLNPAMVACGERLVPGARWQVADAMDLPAPDGSADLVACQFGAMFFPDRPRAYAEARRILRDGAPLLLAIWDTVESSAFPAALVGALTTLYGDAAPDFLSRIPHGYADPGLITRDLQAGGFAHVDVERVVLAGHCPSARILAEGFCLGTPLRSALARFGAPAEVTGAVADELERRLGGGPVTGPLSAFVAVARAG